MVADGLALHVYCFEVLSKMCDSNIELPVGLDFLVVILE